MDVLLWILGFAGSALFSWFFSRLYYRKALETQSREAAEQIEKLTALADERQAAEALDLRLRLRKADVDHRRTVESLPPLLQEARQSRAAVLAALGTLNSGAWEAWVGRWNEDVKAAEAAAAALPKEPSDHRDLSNEDLEAVLVRLHNDQGRADALRDTYRASLAWDEKQRDHLRADQRSRMQAMLSGD
jgi:hypothetical protein